MTRSTPSRRRLPRASLPASCVLLAAAVAAAQPDLVVTDLWPDEGQIRFQVMNKGEAEAPPEGVIALLIDDDVVAETRLAPLPPGERLGASFDVQWNCTGLSDRLEVRADHADAVPESDERNNARVERWACDAVAPTLTEGPTVSEITRSSAVISWSTDEETAGQVRWGRRAGELDGEAWSRGFGHRHAVTLDGLDPSRTYHFEVRSTDASGNTAATAAATLRTEPAADRLAPRIEIDVPTEIREDRVDLEIKAEDDVRVAKVDFLIDDTIQVTDTSEPFSLSWETAELENGDYVLSFRAWDDAGRWQIESADVRLARPVDLKVPTVAVSAPKNGATVSGTVSVEASLSDDRGLADALLYIDGVYLKFEALSPSLKTATVKFSWDSTTVGNGSHTIGVKVYDVEGKTGVDTVTVTVQNAPPPPRPKLVVIDHRATRKDHALVVSMTVKNVGQGAASKITIQDLLKAFQPTRRTTTVPTPAVYTTQYSPANLEWTSTIKSQASLAPGGQQTFQFGAVPVLVHPSQPKPSIGHKIRLSYRRSDGVGYSDEVKMAVLQTTAKEPITTAHRKALQSADYLIATDPQRLFSHYMSWAVDELLAEMAQLAVYNQGALGFVKTGGSGGKDALRNLVKSGGAWAKSLSASFSTDFGGYLLIVGETEIVPSYTQSSVRETDHPYGDATGDGVPDRTVGRIIGDSAVALVKPLRASNGVYAKESGHDFARDVAVAISDPGIGPFVHTVDSVAQDMLTSGFQQVRKQHLRYDFIAGSFGHGYSVDAIAVADVSGTARDEIVVGDVKTDTIRVLDQSGKLLRSIAHPFDLWDLFAAGDVTGDAKAEIIVGDLSADRISIYGSTAKPLLEIKRTLDFGDGLAVGDVLAAGKGQLLFADVSADRVSYLEIQKSSGSGLSAVEKGHVTVTVDPFDRLATGDVKGDGRHEIVLSDLSEDEIRVYEVGTKSWSSWEHKKTGGLDILDPVVVGKVRNLFGKAEILVGDLSYDRFFVTAWNSSKASWGWAGEIPYDFDNYQVVAVGDVDLYLNTVKAEVVVAGAGQKIRILDTDRNWILRAQSALEKNVKGTDVLYFQGHANRHAWSSVVNSFLPPGHHEAVFPMDFDSHHPVVISTSCTSGNYEEGSREDKNIAETFLANDAGVYVGATEQSAIGLNREFGKAFFDDWLPFEPFGLAFATEERRRWKLGGLWPGWVLKYNLYGDPKFGAAPPLQTTAAPAAELETLESVLDVPIPKYRIRPDELPGGLDHVEVPDGELLQEEGRPWVPTYTVSRLVPPGTRVREVRLRERSERVEGTGLELAMTARGAARCVWNGVPCSGIEDWSPTEEYRWEVVESADGSSTLVVTIYPFRYNPLTTDFRFYDRYSFEVVTVPSQVSVSRLALERSELGAGDELVLMLELANPGEPLEVVIWGEIQDYVSGRRVAGLPLETLRDLGPRTTHTLRLADPGLDPGSYRATVVLRDASGTVLDRASAPFRAAPANLEITHLEAAPERFGPDDRVTYVLEFANIGATATWATAVVRVRDPEGSIVYELTRESPAVAPGERVRVEAVWEPAEVATGTYTLLGHVLYESTATGPARVEINGTGP